jgi:hypothetical protein
MRFICLALVSLACLSPGTADARQDPKPPPSGVTLHPFGAPGAKPIPVPVILHRMFVTGDAQQKPGQALSHGRAAVRVKKPNP